MAVETRRKTPEELLRQCEMEAEHESRKGYLKIFLGYVSGVGKSFKMLDEARRRRERGQDVVIGAMQPKVPQEVAELLANLEVFPLKKVDQGTAIDVDALVRRHPTVCFIDGLASDNPPGARNATRWQDVEELLHAGIKVVGSINIQYIAELSKQVEAITGKHVTETVPVSFIKSADEIEIVDAPPDEPIEHTSEGGVDGKRSEQSLSKLRELALLLAADVVDHQLTRYLERQGIQQHLGAQERILVCITPRANLTAMLETAQLMSQKFHGELIVAYVNQPDISPKDRAALEDRLQLAHAVGARVEILDGEDPIEAILSFAHSRGITQLFIGHSQRSGIGPRLLGNPVDKLITRARGMDLRIFPQ